MLTIPYRLPRSARNAQVVDPLDDDEGDGHYDGKDIISFDSDRQDDNEDE